MDFDAPFDEVVLIELPSQDEAERLWLRLQPTRLTWVDHREDTYFVVSVLRAEVDDLALLLRELEAWLGERRLGQVQFELDGRTYALRARPASVVGAID